MLLELEITDKDATLEKVKPDVKDDAHVMVLRVSVVLDFDVLAFFDPTLKDRYFKFGAVDLIEGWVLKDRGEVYPHSRVEEMSGATAKIGTGLGDPMVFPSANLTKFKLTPQDGGFVIVSFDLHIRADEAQAGRLCFLKEEKAKLTIEPAQLAEMKAAA